MKFFLDSAKIDEIKYASEMWNINGVTTNHRHVHASGKPFMTVIREIGEVFIGTDKTISVEIDPHLKNWNEMVKQGKEYSTIHPNFVIKIPSTEAGFKACQILTNEGVATALRALSLAVRNDGSENWHIKRDASATCRRISLGAMTSACSPKPSTQGITSSSPPTCIVSSKPPSSNSRISWVGCQLRAATYSATCFEKRTTTLRSSPWKIPKLPSQNSFGEKSLG